MMKGRPRTALFSFEEVTMASTKQRKAARKNVKKAAAAAKKKRTIAHLSKKTRTALGKQGAKVAKQKRKSKAKAKARKRK
jgi:hypothetical protein